MSVRGILLVIFIVAVVAMVGWMMIDGPPQQNASSPGDTPGRAPAQSRAPGTSPIRDASPRDAVELPPPVQPAQSTTVAADASNTATSFKTNLSIPNDDYYNDMVLVMTGGNTNGQVRLIERILERRRGRGVIWTLQRPELASRFDTILVMRNGRLVEQGSYEDLTETGTTFKTLVAAE